MQCLEALIAHQVLQWTPSSTLAESTHRLYKQHTQLLDNSKVNIGFLMIGGVDSFKLFLFLSSGGKTRRLVPPLHT